jgi:hypothetical protein
MSATYKKIYTKPSVSDVWAFESDIMTIDFLTGNFNNIFAQKLNEEFSGFIGFEVLETITLEELESRKAELEQIRPDLYDMLFELIWNDYTDGTTGTAIELMKKHNIPPVFDAFSTTRTEIIEFDTWENSINAYETLTTQNKTYFDNLKDKLTEYNNTVVEEFYIDGVKQDYIGVMGN